MIYRLAISLVLLGIVTFGSWGCSRQPAQPTTTGVGSSPAPGQGKARTPASAAPAMGLNPNFQGSANGGLGSKAGGQ
jgi:hypothetical protein